MWCYTVSYGVIQSHLVLYSQLRCNTVRGAFLGNGACIWTIFLKKQYFFFFLTFFTFLYFWDFFELFKICLFNLTMKKGWIKWTKNTQVSVRKIFISFNAWLLKIFARGPFRGCGRLPLLALLAYSKVSKIKFSSICFLMTKNRPLQAKIHKSWVSTRFNKKIQKNRPSRPPW